MDLIPRRADLITQMLAKIHVLPAKPPPIRRLYTDDFVLVIRRLREEKHYTWEEVHQWITNEGITCSLASLITSYYRRRRAQKKAEQAVTRVRAA